MKEIFWGWFELIGSGLESHDLTDRNLALLQVLLTICLILLIGFVTIVGVSGICSQTVLFLIDPPIESCRVEYLSGDRISGWVIYGVKPWVTDVKLWQGDWDNALIAWDELGCTGTMVNGTGLNK